MRRQLHCAAYNALIAVISSTQTDPKFYNAFLFSESPNKVRIRGQFFNHSKFECFWHFSTFDEFWNCVFVIILLKLGSHLLIKRDVLIKRWPYCHLHSLRLIVQLVWSQVSTCTFPSILVRCRQWTDNSSCATTNIEFYICQGQFLWENLLDLTRKYEFPIETEVRKIQLKFVDWNLLRLWLPDDNLLYINYFYY